MRGRSTTGGRAYLGGPDGKLHALDATSGRERWNRSADAGNRITVADGTVYTGPAPTLGCGASSDRLRTPLGKDGLDFVVTKTIRVLL
ncbi:PQQ-binding-like beta-propeller repeat protein [Nonomuraea glycinis]|uniref:PQQ-like beta-propeller repeat protein n=1 Tax=Nonomuraea glycinis TaxID=2047744 RepID=A0A918A009_9ACTN|nr:PQQ-binding-like beta-propeller repeat protein [Nonomuraea glycinis]GGP02205.1 hypothetical protein GCM10012278_08510 [Nonomuraea glycinis]